MTKKQQLDKTGEAIIRGAMELIIERGYGSSTTKEIARRAGVNECTIFRKFKGKKEIVLAAMELPEWNPGLKEDDFSFTYDLEADLISFARIYAEKVTPEMVRISMGLRAPELFDDVSEGILQTPRVFKSVLNSYFEEMAARGRVSFDPAEGPEGLAMTFLSMNFGFVFLKGSFGDKLTPLEQEAYIRQSVRAFVHGIRAGADKPEDGKEGEV